MTLDDKLIGQICRQINEDLGDGTTAAKLKKFESTIHSQTLRRANSPCRPHRRITMIAAGILVLLGASFFGLLFASDRAPLPVRVGNQLVENATGIQLNTGQGTTKKVLFNNGSSIQLLHQTVAKLQRITDKNVVVQLQQGELFLDVEGKETESWTVELGEYRVSVLGTRFYVKWHDGGDILDVRVVKGTVLVEGKYAGKVGIAVSADTHLRVDTQSGFSVMNNMSSPFYDANAPSLLANENTVSAAWNDRYRINTSPSNAGTKHIQITSVDNTVKLIPGTEARAKPGVHGHPSDSRRIRTGTSHKNANGLSQSSSGSPDQQNTVDDWQTLLIRGDYSGAIAAAEAENFNMVLEEATLTELWKLMNGARKSGKDYLAEQTLMTCRRRFQTASKARLAAFVLGKVNYYGKKDAQSAAKWFETYLNESPSGPLVEEAMGRLVAIHDERGDTAKAQKLAAEYLNRYPDGAFAKTCRELLKNLAN
ncbi:MAG: FecR domain-containing protein [Deltaproteobacteria bacterium]|nr:FecR domain-containing protein [Deltaproteobacteria bacterium]